MKRRLKTIEVRDQQEFEAIQRGIDDPEGRAVITIIGTLLPYDKPDQKRIIKALLELEGIT